MRRRGGGAWAITDEIIAGWHNMRPPSFPNYGAGAWGPPEADDLIEAVGTLVARTVAALFAGVRFAATRFTV